MLRGIGKIKFVSTFAPAFGKSDTIKTGDEEKLWIMRVNSVRKMLKKTSHFFGQKKLFEVPLHPVSESQ